MLDKRSQPRGIPRPLEVVTALAALVAAAPVVASLAGLVRVSSRGPVLFRQQRVGHHGHQFTLYKFRTMVPENAGPQFTTAGDRRITPIGRWLRKLKLDELPSLWNVVVGDMSLVGPRPEVPRYVDLANPAWQRVLSARPGLTDPVTIDLRDEEHLLDAVEGDKELFYAQVLIPYKLAGYARYLETRTFWSDLRVLGATVGRIIAPESASPPELQRFMAAAKAQ
jgi:lipopolysaccharide/colanic/teichoic acid biosynthesis glycosyltransferase